LKLLNPTPISDRPAFLLCIIWPEIKNMAGDKKYGRR